MEIILCIFALICTNTLYLYINQIQKSMAYIIKDNNPQYGGQCYFVGTRRIKDPQGRDCEAADFGDKASAKRFTSRDGAMERVRDLNKMAGKQQFTIEEDSIYGQQYGRKRTNGFAGFGRLPEPQPAMHGGFVWDDDEDDGYNGF